MFFVVCVVLLTALCSSFFGSLCLVTVRSPCCATVFSAQVELLPGDTIYIPRKLLAHSFVDASPSPSLAHAWVKGPNATSLTVVTDFTFHVFSLLASSGCFKWSQRQQQRSVSVPGRGTSVPPTFNFSCFAVA